MENNKKKHLSNEKNVQKNVAKRTLFDQVLGSLDKEIVEKIISQEHVVKMGGVSREIRGKILDDGIDTAVVKVDRTQSPQTTLTSLTLFVHRYHVKHLDLSGFQITEELTPLFVDVIGNCRAMTHLNLTRCRMGAQGIMALDSAWANCQSLEHVDFTENTIGPQGARSVGTLLQKCSSLLYLNLNGNKIRSQGITTIAAQVSSARPLLHLHLDGNFLPTESSTEVGPSVQKLLSNFADITHLSLARNYIDDMSMQFIAEAIALCSKLTHLNMNTNMIQPLGAYFLAIALGPCQALKELKIGRNGIRSDGLIDLCNILQTLPALETLDIQLNDLSERGIKVLASAFRSFQSLKCLNLANNQLVHEISTIAQALPSCVTLVEFHVSLSPKLLGKIDMLAHALQMSPALQFIYIYDKKGVGFKDLPPDLTLTRKTDGTIAIL